jgi:hypothetical protein
MSMKIPVLGSAFGILAAAFIGAVQALDEAPRAHSIMPIIMVLMGVKFRIDNRFGDRSVATASPLKFGLGLVWPIDRAQRRLSCSRAPLAPTT